MGINDIENTHLKEQNDFAKLQNISDKVNILNKKRNLTVFIFLPFLGIWEVRHIIDSYLLLLYMCIIRT